VTEGPVGGEAVALERALRDEGFDVRVEQEGRLAVIVPHDASRATAALRARAWPLARAAGFTHAAVELLPTVDLAPGASAAVPGD
jgi:hypothetical protein